MNKQTPDTNFVPQPGPACLSLQEIEQFVNMQGSAEWRQRALEHIQQCASCHAEVDLLAEFESATPAGAERADVDWVVARLQDSWRVNAGPRSAHTESPPLEVSEGVSSWWKRLFSWNAPAPAFVLAAALLALLAGISLMRQSSADLMLDPTGESRVLRSGHLRLLAPAGEVSSVPEEFRWEPVEGAARYRVALLGVDGAIHWTAETTDATLRLSEGQLAPVLPGRTLLWSVVAAAPDGTPLSEVTEQEFRLLPR